MSWQHDLLLTTDEVTPAPGRLDQLRRLLEAYRRQLARHPKPDAAEQQATIDRMLAFANEHPDALSRTCEIGHFTGSAAVVDATREHALLLFHRKVQRWLQPGGHADGDGNLVGVALREATEETGIAGLRVSPLPLDVDIHTFVDARNGDQHLHLDVRFVVVAPPGAQPQGNHESDGLRWVTAAEAEQIDSDGSVVRLVRAALQP